MCFKDKIKGQITAEFIIILILLFSLFSVIVFVSVQQKENTDLSSQKIMALSLAENISRNVNGIYFAGNKITITIPKKYDFGLITEENIIQVNFGSGNFVSSSVITKKINLTTKENSTEIKISNNNGVIEIEEL